MIVALRTKKEGREEPAFHSCLPDGTFDLFCHATQNPDCGVWQDLLFAIGPILVLTYTVAFVSFRGWVHSGR